MYVDTDAPLGKAQAPEAYHATDRPVKRCDTLAFLSRVPAACSFRRAAASGSAMIHTLRIRNLAIVEEIEIEFAPGFNVLTGETGAGKSIIVGALGVLVGGRASSDLVRTGAERAVVEATVDLPADGASVIRREIVERGRGRMFIDRALAAAADLRELGRRFVDIHGQHAHQALLDPRSHADFLDAYGRLGADAADVRARFRAWRTACDERDDAERDERDRQDRAELARFQHEEIERAAPEPGEDERLSAERTRLANAEQLRHLCHEAYATLYERDDAAVALLARVWQGVAELARLDPARFEPYAAARDAVDPVLDDLAAQLRSYGSAVEISPDRLADVEARLAELERLKKKYGPDLDQVFARRDALAAQLSATDDAKARRALLDQRVRTARDAYLEAARGLSAARVRHARTLGVRLVAELAELAMPNGRVEVRVKTDLPEGAWTEQGTDAVELFLCANPGEALRPLANVASGGELARVMLALKTLASTDAPGKTLLFDEVDAGIGGAAAGRVGARLRDLGATFQVLCVTHAPQIAAAAGTHHRVSKAVRRGRTRTVVERLDPDERVREIARLMTGSASGAATASARELLASQSAGVQESASRQA